jgi:hypothetical protein
LQKQNQSLSHVIFCFFRVSNFSDEEGDDDYAPPEYEDISDEDETKDKYWGAEHDAEESRPKPKKEKIEVKASVSGVSTNRYSSKGSVSSKKTWQDNLVEYITSDTNERMSEKYTADEMFCLSLAKSMQELTLPAREALKLEIQRMLFKAKFPRQAFESANAAVLAHSKVYSMHKSAERSYSSGSD